MSDIVTRLRALADELDRPGTKGYAVVMREAVDALSERNRMLRHFSMAMAEKDAKLAEWPAEYQRWTVENARLKPEADVLRNERDEAQAALNILSDTCERWNAAREKAEAETAAIKAKLEHVELERNCMEERLAEDQERLAEGENPRVIRPS